MTFKNFSNWTILFSILSIVLLWNGLNILNSYWVLLNTPQVIQATTAPSASGSADVLTILNSQFLIGLIEVIVGLIALILACFVFNKHE